MVYDYCVFLAHNGKTFGIKWLIEKFLYNYCTGEVLLDGHQAMVDVKATTRILQYADFWKHPGNYIYKVDDVGNTITSNNQSSRVFIPNKDSDTDDDNDEPFKVGEVGNNNNNKDDNKTNMSVPTILYQDGD
jgi:hypothetical protein